MFQLMCTLSLVALVAGHGYMTTPTARQYKCFLDGNFWWPANGDNIPDRACREAYKKVFYKYRAVGVSESEAASAAQYMFQQNNEYAALAGPNYRDMAHIKRDVVPHTLCGAGANDRLALFGDKSGMDEYSYWRPNVLTMPSRNSMTYNTNLIFCPTAVHEPSYFEVYITRPNFNVRGDTLTWNDLELIGGNGSALVPNPGDTLCNFNQVYTIPTVIPHRSSQFILYVRWQRIDPVGEGFYNCVDAVFGDIDDECRYAEAAKVVKRQLASQPKRGACEDQEDEVCHANRYDATVRDAIDEL